MDEKEIRLLLKRIRQGDQAAYDRLARALTPFIRQTCRFVAARKSVEIDDGVQEALLLIPQAARDFDLRRSKVRFEAFLRPRIVGAVTTYQRTNQRQRVSKSVWDADIGWIFDDDPVVPKPTRQRNLKRPIADFWPEAAITLVRRCKRKNDRLIAKWLWLDYPAKRQADIARRLRISRSAVFQRKQLLQNRLFRKFGKLYMGEQLIVKPLNDFFDFAIDEGIDE